MTRANKVDTRLEVCRDSICEIQLGKIMRKHDFLQFVEINLFHSDAAWMAHRHVATIQVYMIYLAKK